MDAFATYEGHGVKCSYPSTWNVQEDDTSDESNGFLIESRDAAFFAVSIFPWSDAPREVLERAAKTLEGEYEECEIEWIDSDLSVRDSRAIEVRFFLLDMLVVAKLRAFSLAHQTFLLEQQAEDREYQKVEAVFDAMTETLIQSLDKEHGLQRLHRQ
jgi:hypothetical protein